jgi:hypothetical protein
LLLVIILKEALLMESRYAILDICPNFLFGSLAKRRCLLDHLFYRMLSVASLPNEISGLIEDMNNPSQEIVEHVFIPDLSFHHFFAANWTIIHP